MSKGRYRVIDGETRKVKKRYVVIDAVTHKIKKSYRVVDGVTRLFYSALDVKPVLNDNDWKTIAEVSALGLASTYWRVGDTKVVSLNGTDYIFRIIGFDHDNLNSADAKYSDSSYNGGKKKAGITFEMSALFATYYYMNSANSNSGGWNSSYMRNTVMNTMKGYMPTELKNVLRKVSKLTSKGDTSTTIQTSADQLFLLSEIEVYGYKSVSAAGEGSQYSYYAAGNSRIKQKGSSNTAWWLRSPSVYNTSQFARILANGSESQNSANHTATGVSFCFCI